MRNPFPDPGQPATEPRVDAGVPRLGPLRWERIQLVVELEVPAGARIDPSRLELRRLDEGSGGAAMPPTWAGASGGGIRARFNVMLGPGQRPLASGRWTLAHGGAPVALERPDPVDAFLAERVFAYPGGRYRVTPTITSGAALALDIRHGRFRRRSRAWSRVAWKHRLRRQRGRLFRALIGLHRRIGGTSRRMILFTSDSHAGLTGNQALVHGRLVERGLAAEYRLETVFKPGLSARRSWRDRFRLPRLLALADVIVLDDYQPSIYHLEPRPGQRVVQLWHASGAFKTVGYSRIGKPGGPSPLSRRHKNYTHAIVSGQHDVPYYAEAFGIPEDRVVPTGIPRMDRFFDQRQRTAGRDLAFLTFPQIRGRTTILLAPTFRGNGPRDAWYDYDRVDWYALHRLAVEKDALVILKMHPFIRQAAPIPDALRDRIVDGSNAMIDVNDLLFAVDLLITDYSSIVFEFSILGRPMLFFAYDLDEYVASRDFYVPFEEFVPGRIVRSFDQLLDAVREEAYEAEKVPAFARRHFDHLDGGAIDRVIDEVILGREDR